MAYIRPYQSDSPSSNRLLNSIHQAASHYSLLYCGPVQWLFAWQLSRHQFKEIEPLGSFMAVFIVVLVFLQEMDMETIGVFFTFA